MDKNVFLLLIGDAHGQPIDGYQELQAKDAGAVARAAGIRLEAAWATSFDQYGALRRHLLAGRTDAVIVEPASVATASLILRHLQGHAGLVILNAWDASFEQPLLEWGKEHPVGTVSQPQERIGRLQGQQLSAATPQGGHALLVTGPARSSASRERLEGLRGALRADVTLHTTEAGQWSESDGILAFNAWYGVFRTRREEIHAIAGQSDDLAIGAQKAARAVSNPAHAAMFRGARLLGVGAVPGYGRELVDAGRLAASVTVKPNAGLALTLLRQFWAEGRPLPPRTQSEAEACPPLNAERLAG